MAAEEFVVRGSVTEASGAPAAGLAVRARDRNLRKPQPLGELAVTGPDGRYEIRYSRRKFGHADKGYADLVVRVFAPDRASDTDEALIASPTLFKAPVEAVIDLKLPSPRDASSEFQRHGEVIRPLLVQQKEDGSDLEMADLEIGEVDFVASDTGIERQHIVWLQSAFQTGGQLGHEDGPACCYGWFRLGIPTEPAALWATPVERLMQAVKDAVARQIIPKRVAVALDAIEAAVRRRQATQLLHAPRFGRGSTGASLSEMLAVLPSPLDSEHEHALAAVADSLQPDDPTLVARLAAIPGLERGAPSVARVLRLGALTDGNVPLARALQERLSDDADEGGRCVH